MIGRLPPYALHTLRFRFRALATQAGRSSLGGDREVVLACFVAARIGAGLFPEMRADPAKLQVRAVAARQWLSSISVPGQVRQAVGAVISASAGADAVAAARALTHLLLLAPAQLDEASVAEIQELVDELAPDVAAVP